MITDPHGLVAGAGFIANSGLLGPDRSYIGGRAKPWSAWTHWPTSAPMPSAATSKAEWFRVPVETGRPQVTGPYVAFLCTDEYVLTFTHPVFRSPEPAVAGVIGIDVTIQTLERCGLRLLRTIGERATVVNADGRALISVTPDIEAGDRVEPAPDSVSSGIGHKFHIWTAALSL